MNEKIVERLLITHPNIEDCAVLPEVEGKGLTAYIVLDQPIPYEGLQSQLDGHVPSQWTSINYVPVSHIPLKDDGRVDKQDLAVLKVVDRDLVEEWERQVQSMEGVGKVAIQIEEYVKKSEYLHLNDLLPQRGDEDAGGEEFSGRDVEDSLATRRETVPAISCGGDPSRNLGEATLSKCLFEAASQVPEKGIFYVGSDGSEQYQSYADLLSEAERVMGGLRKSGIKPGDPVILQSNDNRDFVTALWGCILGGFVPVLLSIRSFHNQSNFDINKLQNAWDALEHPLVLASGEMKPAIDALGVDVRCLSVDALRRNGKGSEWHNSRPSEPAIMLLTSGSTGTPKIVVLSHRNIVCQAAGAAQFMQIEPSCKRVILNWMPLEHVGGVVMFHMAYVFLGYQQVQTDTEVVLNEPLKWLDLIDRFSATITWAPNFAFGLVNSRAKEIGDGQWDLSSIRHIVNGGEAIVCSTAQKFLELLAPHGLSPTAMRPAWGMSETSSGVTYSHDFTMEAAGSPSAFVDVGRPISGVSIRIVDDRDRVISENEVGRIQIRGDTVIAGYWQNPAANREAFTEDDWFNTGDLGLLADGSLTVTGREKDIIIINGVNYYCHEIENVVERSGGVEPTYVAASAVRRPGDNTDRLAVFFSPAHGVDNNPEETIEAIRTLLTEELSLHPDYIVPMPQEDMPRSEIGKIQRVKLREKFAEGGFDTLLRQLDLRSRNENTIPDWFYQRKWVRQEETVSEPGVREAPYIIFMDQLGLGRLIKNMLCSPNSPCIAIERGTEFAESRPGFLTIDPRQRAHYLQLAAYLKEKRIERPRILHLWTYEAFSGEVADVEAIKEAQYKGVYSLTFLLQALAGIRESIRCIELYVVSSHTMPALPTDRTAYENSTLIGLLKTAPLELSWVRCQHIDLDMADARTDASRVVAELRTLNGKAEVAYRDRRRLIPVCTKVNMLQKKKVEMPIGTGGLYMITGGLGGIGTALAKMLIERFDAKLLLVGQTALPPKEDWPGRTHAGDKMAKRIENYRSIEEVDGDFIYEAVDVCDQSGLERAALKAESRWKKPLAGIFHLAGNLTGHENLISYFNSVDSHRVVSEKVIQFENAFNPKVYGTWTLFKLLEDRPQTVFVSFSSVTGLFGSSNFSAYSAANSFLSCFSLSKRCGSGPRMYDFIWSMWDDVGMSSGIADSAKAMSANVGYDIISTERGLTSLLAGLYRNKRQLIVGLDGNSPTIRRHLLGALHQTQRVYVYYTGELDREHPFTRSDTSAKYQTGSDGMCEFSRLDAMPLKENGQIDREALSAVSIKSSQSDGHVPPRTDVERQIASIWQDLLDIPQLSMNDNFFELGGSSLTAFQFLARLKKLYKIDLPVTHFFRSPSLAGVVAALNKVSPAGETGTAISVRTRDNHAGRDTFSLDENSLVPLSFTQRPLWFLQQMESDNPYYNNCLSIRMRGPLEVGALRHSINAIVDRHEVLRTCFPEVQGQPAQRIITALEVDLPVDDLQGVELSEREAVLSQRLRREGRRLFNLSEVPLLRVCLLRLQADDHLLVLTIHHLVSDGWSMGIFYRELGTFYGAHVRGEEALLDELPIQYADFTRWQSDHMQEAALEKMLAYWKSHLAGAPRLLELPIDHPRPAVQRFRGAFQTFTVEAPLKKKLELLGTREGTTLFVTLLAAFEVLLYRYTRQADLVVGTPVANRSRTELESLIGPFVNTLTLRTDLSGDPSFREVIARVHHIALEAYAHQEVPFEYVVDELELERNLGFNPLFQVMFVLQNTPMEELQMEGLEVDIRVFDNGSVKFDLILELAETVSGLDGYLHYNTDLFDDSTAAQIIGHFALLLEGVVADPDCCLLDLSMEENDAALRQNENSDVEVPFEDDHFDFNLV